MTFEEQKELQSEIPNSELIERAEKCVDIMRAGNRSGPPDVYNDPDLIFSELIRRYKEGIELIEYFNTADIPGQ